MENSKISGEKGDQITLQLADALAKHGVEGWKAFEFLERQYTAKTWNYQQEPLRPAATRELFRGAGPYQASAHRYAVRHRAKQIRERAKHYLQRAGSRLGVYRYPGEKKK